jgi:hypothetical protein
MLSFFDMDATFKQLLSGNLPRNSRLARWDRRVLMGLINLTLFAVLVGTVLDVLDVHFTWKWSTSEPVHMEVTRQHWGSLSFNPEIVSPDVRSQLPPGVEPWLLTGNLKVDTRGFVPRMLNLATTVPLGALLFAIVWIVRRIVQTTIGTDESAGDPFIRANVRRLRMIAVLLIAQPIFSEAATIAQSELVRRAVPITFTETLVLEYYPDSMFLFFGLGIFVLVIAEVFKAGVQLREDVEGLV